MQIKHLFVLIHIRNNGKVGHANKNTRKHHTAKRAKRSALSQLIITRLHVTDLLRQHITKTKMKHKQQNDPQKKHYLGTVRIITGGLEHV